MIVFTHIPKTAGTTLKMILRNNFGKGHIDSAKVKRPVFTGEDMKFARTVFRNPQAISGHNLVNPVRNIGLPDMKLITFLRDPVTRCASHYQDDVLRGGFSGSFGEWISDPRKQNLTVRIIAGSDDLDEAKKLLSENYLFIGITEHFSDSMKLLQVKLGRNLNMNYRRMITARSNHIKQKLLNDPHLRGLLEENNQKDTILYRYAMEEIFFPALRTHAKALPEVPEPMEKQDRQGERQFRKSVRFNKTIYRPLVRLTGRS